MPALLLAAILMVKDTPSSPSVSCSALVFFSDSNKRLLYLFLQYIILLIYTPLEMFLYLHSPAFLCHLYYMPLKIRMWSESLWRICYLWVTWYFILRSWANIACQFFHLSQKKNDTQGLSHLLLMAPKLNLQSHLVSSDFQN